MRNPERVLEEETLVRRANELARRMYHRLGGSVERNHRFDTSSNNAEILMWDLAVLAFSYIEKTDVETAVSNLIS